MNNNLEKGFSIVEIALVLILFGFVSSTVLLGLKTYTEQKRVLDTTQGLQQSQQAISQFAAFNGGRYPCPAPLNVGPGNPLFGDEIITGAATPAAIDAILDGIETIGQNDIDNNGVRDTFVWGAVPFKTILNSDGIAGINSPKDALTDFDFASKHAFDGWGNKVFYAVSRHLCEPGNPLGGIPQGVLDVVTDQQCEQDPVGSGNFFPQSVLPGSCAGPDRRYAQFIILSHGANTRGAYNREGVEIDDCLDVGVLLPAGDPGLGGADDNTFFNGNVSDRKNCKYESDLDPRLSNEGEFFYGLRAEATEDTTYDDYIKFYYEDNFKIFSSTASIEVPASGATPAYEISRMINVNTGNIGIGVDSPDEALHVGGDVQAFDIHADEYCASINDGKCMDPTILGGPGIACPPGEAIQSISENDVQCAPPFAGITFTCNTAAGEKLKGIRSDGTAICIIP